MMLQSKKSLFVPIVLFFGSANPVLHSVNSSLGLRFHGLSPSTAALSGIVQGAIVFWESQQRQGASLLNPQLSSIAGAATASAVAGGISMVHHTVDQIILNSGMSFRAQIASRIGASVLGGVATSFIGQEVGRQVAAACINYKIGQEAKRRQAEARIAFEAIQARMNEERKRLGSDASAEVTDICVICQDEVGELTVGCCGQKYHDSCHARWEELSSGNYCLISRDHARP